jgi:hypothetical protein
MQRSDFKRHLIATYGISDGNFERIYEEFLSFFGQTLDEYVVRRHGELHGQGRRNQEIYGQIRAEAEERRFAARDLSERRVRRIIYG